MQRVFWMGLAGCVAIMPIIVTGQMEETGGAMIGNDTSLIQFQAPKCT